MAKKRSIADVPVGAFLRGGRDIDTGTHYMRAIDTRGRGLSKSAIPFNNDSEGFQSAK